MFNQRWNFAALLANFTTSRHCMQLTDCNILLQWRWNKRFSVRPCTRDLSTLHITLPALTVGDRHSTQDAAEQDRNCTALLWLTVKYVAWLITKPPVVQLTNKRAGTRSATLVSQHGTITSEGTGCTDVQGTADIPELRKNYVTRWVRCKLTDLDLGIKCARPTLTKL